jgi:hypothetical protein
MLALPEEAAVAVGALAPERQEAAVAAGAQAPKRAQAQWLARVQLSVQIQRLVLVRRYVRVPFVLRVQEKEIHLHPVRLPNVCESSTFWGYRLWCQNVTNCEEVKAQNR